MTSRASGTYDSDAVETAFREQYCDEPVANRHAQEGQTGLVVRVSWIVDDSTERIAKDGKRLIEADAVVAPIRSFFARIPLERDGHKPECTEVASTIA